MKRTVGKLALLLLLALAVLAVWLQAGTAMRVGAGITARVVCALAHHTGLDPEWTMGHYMDPLLGAASHFVSVTLDRETGVVESRAALLGRGRAIVREGIGCTLVLDEAALRTFRDPPHAPPLPVDEPWPGGNAPLATPVTPALADALDAAFEEPEAEEGYVVIDTCRPLEETLADMRGLLVGGS